MNTTSGSVIAPVLLSQLIQQNKLAVAIGVTCNDSMAEINNCIRTLESYEGVASVTEKPVILSTHFNTNSSEFDKINQSVASTIMMLATLSSGQNQGLDQADLYNWINYDRVSTAPVKVMSLDIISSDQSKGVENEILKDAQPITVATLARKGANTKTAWVPDYQCVGVLSEAVEKNFGLEHPIHYIISDGPLAAVYKVLREEIDALQRARDARNYTTSMVSDKTKVGKTGLVL